MARWGRSGCGRSSAWWRIRWGCCCSGGLGGDGDTALSRHGRACPGHLRTSGRATSTVTEEAGGWIYILTNRPNGTLYVGVTNHLVRRVWEHRNGVGSEFARKYYLKRLVHY